jgi:Ca2+-binding RTX toxin-like protein
LGYLDYALANADLLDEVTGVTAWHINADEPDLIDYDTTFKQDAQDAIYAPDGYRSSDHDPVLVGLNLVPQCDGQSATIYVNANGTVVGGPHNGNPYRGWLVGTLGADVMVGTDGRDRINGLNGDDVICGGVGPDTLIGWRGNDSLFGDEGRDSLWGYFGSDTLNAGDGYDFCYVGEGPDSTTDCETIRQVQRDIP